MNKYTINPHVPFTDSVEKLDFIDGLRGVAILMVLFFHTSLAVGDINSFQEKRIFVEHFSRGVQLFFIISAFTLFRSFKKRKGENKKPIISFYIRRFFRIIPLWWIAVILYWFFQRGEHTANDAWITAFMLFGFFEKIQTIALIPVGWSLFVEEVFYLFFPLVGNKISGPAISLFFVVLSIWVSEKWIRFGIHSGYDPFFIGTFPLANGYSFFVGISLYFIYEKIKKADYLNCSFFKTFWLDVLCVVSFAAILYTDRVLGTMLLVPLFVISFFNNSICGKILNIKVLKKFGKYCYSIYLFHSLVISQVLIFNAEFINKIKITQENFYGWSLCLFLVISFLSLLVGALSFHLFELPFINLGKKTIKRFAL